MGVGVSVAKNDRQQDTAGLEDREQWEESHKPEEPGTLIHSRLFGLIRN